MVHDPCIRRLLSVIISCMRIWSLHPKYLDRQGLTACWREGLLAQKVLQGGTKGYVNHPQLIRFKRMSEPMLAIATYLHYVVDEAERRGYQFDRSKLLRPMDISLHMSVTSEQIAYEWDHLTHKLKVRSEADYQKWHFVAICEPHPLFVVVPGAIEDWERITEAD